MLDAFQSSQDALYALAVDRETEIVSTGLVASVAADPDNCFFAFEVFGAMQLPYT